MHVDRTLRRPHPVVLTDALNLLVAAARWLERPLHARKIDAPLVAVARRRGYARMLFEHRPRKRQFHRPRPIDVPGVVQRAVDADGRLQSGDLPTVDGLPAVAVRLWQ